MSEGLVLSSTIGSLLNLLCIFETHLAIPVLVFHLHLRDKDLHVANFTLEVLVVLRLLVVHRLEPVDLSLSFLYDGSVLKNIGALRRRSKMLVKVDLLNLCQM